MDRCPSETGTVRPEAAGERPSHEGGATTTAEVKAQGPPQSAGAVRGSEGTTVRQGGMVDVLSAKDGAHRPPQSAGAVRRQVRASRRPHTAPRHLHPAPATQPASAMSMSTDNLQQQQQGQRQRQQQHLISTKSRARRILASRVRGGSGDTDAIRPPGDTNDFNSSA